MVLRGPQLSAPEKLKFQWVAVGNGCPCQESSTSQFQTLWNFNNCSYIVAILLLCEIL